MALPTPVAYWPFNEGSGTTAADASGNGHTATLGHGTWNTTQRIFGAAALANTDGGKAGAIIAINLGTTYSIAFWMNGWDGSNDGVLVGTYINSTGLYHDSGVWTHGGLTGVHHIVLTRSGTSATVYKDGTAISTLTIGSGAFSLDTINGQAAGTLPFVGTLDDVRVYDVALSGAQVAELYALNPDPPGTLAVVQTASAGTSAAASVAVTFATPPPVGQGVVVVIVGYAHATVTTVTDTAGTTYTLAKREYSATYGVSTDVWVAPVLTATATPFTITAAGNSPTQRLAVALAVSGVGAGLAVDQTAGGQTIGFTSGAGPTAALTAADVLLVAGVSLAGGTAGITVGAGPAPARPWVQAAERLAIDPVTGEVDTCTLTVSPGATVSVNWTNGAALAGAAAIVAFYSTGPAPPADPVYVVSIGEVDVNPILATFRIQETIDAPDTLIADVESIGSPAFRPTIGQSVFVTENDVRIFGGSVTGVREQGFSGPNAGDLVVEIQATSYEINAKRRVVTAAFSQGTPAETIGDAFAALVTAYYAELGVTLHPDQVAGPDLPAATFERARGDAVNKQLAASVGYLQAIDFDNQLRAWAPGDVLAPADYDEDVNPELLTGDIQVDRQLQNGYANRVILVGQPITIPDHQDHFTGDGVTDTFPITYQVVGPYPYFVDGAVAFGIVVYTAGSTTESIGGVEAPPGFLWEYDPIAQTIRRRGGPVAAGVAFYFPYHGLFVPEGMAEDAGEIATYGLWEHVEEVTAVTTTLSAQGYADALLAAKLASKDEIVTLQTRALGFHPGQTIAIVSSSRHLSGDFLIAQVDTAAEGGTRLLRSITAAKSQNNNHDWRRVYQQWAGASASESGAAGTSSTTSGAGVGTGLHAATHQLGGLDAIKLDNLATPDDNADLNASTSAHGLLRKLSGSDLQVLRGDGTWGNSPLTSGVFAYTFNTVTTAPPASQRIRFNAAHPYTAVTKVWADFQSSNSEDLYFGWMRIRTGSILIVQDKDAHAQFAEFITTGVPIDQGTYVELPVAWVSNGTALAVQAVLVRVTAPAPGGSTAVRRQVTVLLDGGGSVISTGLKTFLSLPLAGTWKKWRVLSIDSAATSGSIVIDVWKDTYANYPPTVADTITASAKPTLSTATKNESSTLTGWTTAFSAGDVLGFTVDSATTVTKVMLTLEFE